MSPSHEPQLVEINTKRVPVLGISSCGWKDYKKFKLNAFSDDQGVRAVFTINVHTGTSNAKQKGAYAT